jgi:hypothetical protein
MDRDLLTKSLKSKDSRATKAKMFHSRCLSMSQWSKKRSQLRKLLAESTFMILMLTREHRLKISAGPCSMML